MKGGTVPGGIEGSRAIDVSDRLGHRLLHIRTFAKGKLHQSSTLNALAVHRLNACDVEEVVLVIVGKEPFHLCGSHAAVGLSDVDHWISYFRKDIHAHPSNRHEEPSDDCDQRHNDGERTTQSCED
jgi:hypothetical protein